MTTILRDTREQLPYPFEKFNVDVDDVTLRTGDYTVADLCEYDADLDTYVPYLAVERKTGTDFLNSLFSNRDRFKKEIKRADDWEMPLEVVVEESYTTFAHNLGLMEYRDISPKQVTATVDSWTDNYNVNFHFAGDRLMGEQHTHDQLMAWLLAESME